MPLQNALSSGLSPGLSAGLLMGLMTSNVIAGAGTGASMFYQNALGFGLSSGLGAGLFTSSSGSALSAPAGPSVFYHTFSDLVTDSSKYLNDSADTLITMDAEETAGGLQWLLSYEPTSAVVYAVPRLTTPSTPPSPMSASTTITTANGVNSGTVSFDFPVPGPFLTGLYAFYAEVTASGRIDVTSGILVQVNPALGT